MNSFFNFNQFLEPLTKSKIYLLEENNPRHFTSLVDLRPFGTLRYQEKDKQEQDKNIHASPTKIVLEEKLKFYDKEIQRKQELLENDNFCRKAPFQLVENERKKIIYYQEQRKKVLKELEKL